MVKLLKISFVSILVLVLTGCNNENKRVLGQFESGVSAPLLPITENTLAGVDKDGVITLPEAQCKPVMDFRFQHKGFSHALYKLYPFDSDSGITIKDQVPTIWKHSVDRENEQIIVNDSLSVAFPVDSIIGPNCLPFLHTANLVGWGPEYKLDGNIFPGGDLFRHPEVGKLFFSANMQLLSEPEYPRNSSDYLHLKKGTPIKLTFRVDESKADSLLPMWYFDETNCLWKQEGCAVRTGPETYVATVYKLGWWVCYKLKETFVTVDMLIVDKYGQPVHNAELTMRMYSCNKSTRLVTGADGTCSFCVPFKNPNNQSTAPLEIYFNGVSLIEWQKTHPYKGEYIKLPVKDSLLGAQDSLCYDVKLKYSLDFSIDSLKQEYGLPIGLEAVRAEDFNEFCNDKLKLKPSSEPFKIESYSSKILVDREHSSYLFSFKPSQTDLKKFKDILGLELDVWEHLTYISYDKKKQVLEFEPSGCKARGYDDAIFILSDVANFEVDTLYDVNNNKLCYRLKTISVRKTYDARFKYELCYSKGGNYSLESGSQLVEEVCPVRFYLSYPNKKSNYVIDKSLFDIFSDEIKIDDSDKKVKIRAQVGDNDLKIFSVKDEYMRNALIDVSSDYINPVALKSHRLTFEFAGDDSAYNTTINIPSQKYILVADDYHTNSTDKKYYKYSDETSQTKHKRPNTLYFCIYIALIGVYILYRKKHRKDPDEEENTKKKHKDDTVLEDEAVLKVIAAVLRLSPGFSENQKAIISNFYLLKRSEQIVRNIQNLIDSPSSEDDLLLFLPILVRKLGSVERQLLVKLLFKLAVEDDGIQDDEWNLLHRIMCDLELTDDAVKYMADRYEPLRSTKTSVESQYSYSTNRQAHKQRADDKRNSRKEKKKQQREAEKRAKYEQKKQKFEQQEAERRERENQRRQQEEERRERENQRRQQEEERRKQQERQRKQQRQQTTSAGLSDYELLGISSSATLEEVKKAYRRMAMEYHPDLPKNASRLNECVNKMAAINLAYKRILAKF